MRLAFLDPKTFMLQRKVSPGEAESGLSLGIAPQGAGVWRLSAQPYISALCNPTQLALLVQYSPSRPSFLRSFLPPCLYLLACLLLSSFSFTGVVETAAIPKRTPSAFNYLSSSKITASSIFHRHCFYLFFSYFIFSLFCEFRRKIFSEAEYILNNNCRKNE